MTARRYHSSDCPPLSRVPGSRLRVLLVLRHRRLAVLDSLSNSSLRLEKRATNWPSAGIRARFARLPFSREEAATRARVRARRRRHASLREPRTSHDWPRPGIGACLPPLLLNAEERRHERETTPFRPFWLRGEEETAPRRRYIGWRGARRFSRESSLV